MPGGEHVAYERGVRRDLFPDHEKRRAGVVQLEQRKNLRGVLRVRAVVNGQPYLAFDGRKPAMHVGQAPRPKDKEVIRDQPIRHKPQRKGRGRIRDAYGHRGDLGAETDCNQKPWAACKIHRSPG
ncbi:MAG: hypothetical protein NTV51_01430 [Verrucomicrobia bacterium]|nr:hypothetical protein [Verrucomicrobiota bacterium]